MTTNNNTQITTLNGYDTSRIIFSEPVLGSIPDSKPKIEFKRINISTRNQDGTVGELILPTERLFSFGVSENTSQETGNVNGYTFPLCLWSRDGATEEEKLFTDTVENIVSKCIDHVIDNKEELEMYDLTRSDLTKAKGGFNPFYWKKEKYTNAKGKTELRVVPGTGPTLYTKLIYSKKNSKFLSLFFDTNGNELNALDLMGKYCYSNAAIKIESIFIGSKISLQIKLYEAVVEPMNQGMKRLLARPKTQSKVLEHKSGESSNTAPLLLNEDEDDDAGSLLGDDVVEEEQKLPPSSPKVVRKVKKVVKKAA